MKNICIKYNIFPKSISFVVVVVVVDVCNFNMLLCEDPFIGN